MANKIKSKEDFIERMNELAKKGTNLIKESTSNLNNQSLLEQATAVNGRIYGIVKENDKYFIKTSTANKKEKLDESDFSYVGGLANKLDYRYNSLTEAQRNLTYILSTVEQSFGLISEEVAPEEKEAPKAEVTPEPVIKTPVASTTSPAPEATPTPAPETTTKTPEASTEEPVDANKEAIQHLVGKLMGELSDADAKPGLTKWVVNSILGSVNLSGLKDSDKDKMVKKIKGELEEGETLDMSINEDDKDGDDDTTKGMDELPTLTTGGEFGIDDVPITTTGNITSSNTVKIDLNAKTVDVSINESKLRSVVNKVISEQLSGKVSINESKIEKYVAKLVKESIESREKKKLNESTEAVNSDAIAADAKNFFSSTEITQIADVMKNINEADENAEADFEEKLSKSNPALYTKFISFLKKYPGVQRAVVGTILAAKLMGMSTGAMAAGKDDIMKKVDDGDKTKVEKKIDDGGDKSIKVVKTDKGISADISKTFKSGDFKVDKNNTELYKTISDIAHFAVDHPDAKMEITIHASESHVPNQGDLKPGDLADKRAAELKSYIQNILTFNGITVDGENLSIVIDTGVNGPAWDPTHGDTKDDAKFADNQFVKTDIKIVGEKTAVKTGNSQEGKKFKDMWQPVYEDGLKKFDNFKNQKGHAPQIGKIILTPDDAGLNNIINQPSFAKLPVEGQQNIIDNFKQMFEPSDAFLKALSDGSIKTQTVKPGVKF
jgi:hypothetical protein